MLGLAGALAVTPFAVATVLIAPRQCTIGAMPKSLHGEPVTFASQSGATVHGWYIPGKSGRGAVALMHGVNGSRIHMQKRAQWLSGLGYSVLLFDFQACGETIGQSVTFGKRESSDARAAVSYLQQRTPGERIGVIGVSMGGASAILADPPLPVQAMVLESVYPNITDAIHDRLNRVVGDGGANAITPLLTMQMQSRLGFAPSALRPIDQVSKITVPKLFLAGSVDEHTTLKESQALYAAAASPKALWIVGGAAHVNLYDFAPSEYKKRVGGFLGSHLTHSPKALHVRSGSDSTSPVQHAPGLPPVSHHPQNNE